MEAPGGGEVVEGVVDVPIAEGFGRGTVVGVLHPMGGGEFWCVVGVVFAEDAEHAAGGDGAVLGWIADEADGCTRGFRHGEESAEVAVGEGGGSVNDENRARVDGKVVGPVELRVSVSLPWSSCVRSAGRPSTVSSTVRAGTGLYGLARPASTDSAKSPAPGRNPVCAGRDETRI